LFQILLLAGLLSAKRFASFPEYCLHDQDYEELLKIIKDGLGPATHPADVVIVGAGISGLTAAKLLRDAGHNVTILEMSDQVGGRIRTYRPEKQDWYVELGAMRLPVKHRLVHEFVKQFDLKLNPFIQRDDNTWYFMNGTRVRAEEVNRNPNILNYPVKPSERGKSAVQLYREALNKVRVHLPTRLLTQETLNLFPWSCGGASSAWWVESNSTMVMRSGQLNDGVEGNSTMGTDRPSRFIYYPSHNFSSGVGVILASYTWNDDAEFFLPLTDEECLDVVFQDLADIHQVSKKHLQSTCNQYLIQKWQLDKHSLGAFAAFTPYQFVDYSQDLFQHEGRVHFAGEHTAQPHAWIETSIKSAIRAASNIHHDS
ncbi:OXLA oxidase, partial [Nyctiprogne leucopyga]|nr:OXLA oxidase [Nyctiprogne leucopyga]